MGLGNLWNMLVDDWIVWLIYAVAGYFVYDNWKAGKVGQAIGSFIFGVVLYLFVKNPAGIMDALLTIPKTMFGLK